MPVTLVFPQYVDLAFGSSRKSKPKVLRATFGNGYSQRQPDGRNHIEQNYSVSLVNLTRDDALAVEAFFESLGGANSFYFTKPGDSAPTVWICSEWETTHTDALTDSMQCSWERVYVP